MGRLIMEYPWHTLLVLMSLLMLVFGLYLVSPWYPLVPPTGAAMFAEVFTAARERMFLGAFYIGIPTVTLGGIIAGSNRITRSGAFGLFLIYLFAALLRVTTIGFTPVYWLFILGCGFTAGLARIQLNRQ